MWQSDGLAVPEAVKQSTAEYRSEMNPVNDFIDQRCEINLYNPEFQESSADLWDAYQRWAEENGIKYPVKRIEFGKHLRVYGLEPVRFSGERTRVWRGVRLNDQG